MLVLASSNVTIACRLSKSTLAWLTPATFNKAFFTVIGQTGQSMVGTDKVTVFGAAHVFIEKIAIESAANNRFISKSF